MVVFRLFSLLLAFASSALVDGFSTGAGGGCPPNSPAVGGFHVSNPTGVTEVSFEEASYAFQIDGNDVGNIQLVRGETYTITVVASGDPFRGALIRVDGTGVVDAGENSKIADVCEQGVTHLSPVSKERLSGIYVVSDQEMAEVAFDVTIVQANNGRDGSVYSYQRFTLPVIDTPGLAAPPSMAPITNVPIPAPTLAPVLAPTLPPMASSPVEAPTTDEPTSSPTFNPIAVFVTNAPVMSMPFPMPTTAGPTKLPTLSPTMSPMESPVSPPIAPPLAAVVSPPVAVPVAAAPIASTPSSPTDPFPTVPIAWMPATAAPMVPTTIAPFPTVPIPWLPTTTAPVKTPSMFDVPTIPIAWPPPTTESSEMLPLANQTDSGGNATDFNMTDMVPFNETDDMMGHNSTDMMNESGFSAESLESSSMSWWFYSRFTLLFGITGSLLV